MDEIKETRLHWRDRARTAGGLFIGASTSDPLLTLMNAVIRATGR
jgi:hypothetical protein